MQFSVFFSVLYFFVFVCLFVLLCSGSCGLIQINVYMYVFYQLVSSVVTLNTSVTAKVKNAIKTTVLKLHNYLLMKLKLKLMNIVLYQSPQTVAIPFLFDGIRHCHWKHVKRLVYSDSCRLMHSNILSADHSSQYISYDYYTYEGLAVTEKCLSDLHALCVLKLILFHIGWTRAPL